MQGKGLIGNAGLTITVLAETGRRWDCRQIPLYCRFTVSVTIPIPEVKVGNWKVQSILLLLYFGELDVHVGVKNGVAVFSQ